MSWIDSEDRDLVGEPRAVLHFVVGHMLHHVPFDGDPNAVLTFNLVGDICVIGRKCVHVHCW